MAHDDDDREERRATSERLLTTLRRFPISVQIVSALTGCMAVIALIQAVANVASSFIALVLGPLVQWWIR